MYRTKYISVNEFGIYFMDEQIVWNDIRNVVFIDGRSPSFVIKYIQAGKENKVWGFFPSTYKENKLPFALIEEPLDQGGNYFIA